MIAARIALAWLVACLCLAPASSHAAHGVSIDGALKYPAGFERFDYTSSMAATGGHLVLHALGSFDKMNPFTLKGTAAEGIGDLVFEPLAVPSLDEPFAKYGLVAKDIAVAADRLSVTFTIDPAARFSDGTPVRPEDVKFSLETLKSEAAHPFYQAYFGDIVGAEIIAADKVRFSFARPNRELHMIACELPVLSRRYYQSHPFDSPTLEPPVGTGPYTVSAYAVGKYVTYTKNRNYWAADHPARRGMFNFDTITFKYYKDQLVSVEAFKAGEFDFMPVNIAKQWVRDMTGPNFTSGRIVKTYLDHKNNAGMQGFVMNTRRPLFANRDVRHALALAFDFPWTNKTLFFGQYTRCTSYFSNSSLAATGLPKGLELDYLLSLKDEIPPEVFTVPMGDPPGGAASTRANLRRAKKLLAKAGWKVKNGRLVNGRGEVFSFEILLVSPSFERVMAPYVANLRKLGIEATYRTIDPALYTRRVKNFDFDMVVSVFGQSQSPGNEQRDYWSSASADRKGSRNLIGVRSRAVDALVDRIVYAETQAQLTAACRALDRVLWFNYYVVPNWYVARHRVAYWNKFERPGRLPLYYQPEQALFTWWMKSP